MASSSSISSLLAGITGGAATGSSSSSAGLAPGPFAPQRDVPFFALPDPDEDAAEKGGGSVDDLMKLIEDGPGVGDSKDQDMEDLLGCLARTESPLRGPTSAPGSPASQGDISESKSHARLAPDLPDTDETLPPEVKAVPFIVVAKFNLRCEIDLKFISFRLRHAEYNPRKHSSLTVRMMDPRVTAVVRASGFVSLSSSCCITEDQLKRSAKKLARLIQKIDHPDVQFAGYAVTSILCKSDLGFPIRLEALAAQWRKNALYEPEQFCSCVFRTRRPKCTYLVTAGGKVSISGMRKMKDVNDALRRAYFVFKQFRQ